MIYILFVTVYYISETCNYLTGNYYQFFGVFVVQFGYFKFIVLAFRP